MSPQTDQQSQYKETTKQMDNGSEYASLKKIPINKYIKR